MAALAQQGLASSEHVDIVLTPTLAQLPARVGSLRNDADPDADTTDYAADKRGSELALERELGADRVAHLRAGLILGPRENVGRLPWWLRRIARGRPLLFFLDDLHNSGQTTFEGLLRVHQEEPDQRRVMGATVRSEDVQLGTPQAEQLRQLREAMNGIVIDVKPLEAEITAALIRASLPLDDSAVQEAARRSRGNPLFALQQLHAWALAGNMQIHDGVYRVPDEVLTVRPQTTAELWDSRVKVMPLSLIHI